MILDANPVLSHLFSEPQGAQMHAILAGAPSLVMSTVTLAEVAIGIEKRGMDPELARTYLQRLGCEFVPVTVETAWVAARARHRYPINFGDACVYALAKELNLPILTLDAEFAKTDADLVPLAP
ncbi:hypothetical protein BH11ARM2_BH11ARM2_37750 [soil metagenome]